MARIYVLNDPSGCIIVSFPYDPLLVSKVKTIDGRRWHPTQKHWSFPNKDGMLEKILKIFGDNEVQIDPTLKTTTSKVKDTPSPLRPKGTVPDLRMERSEVVESGLSQKFDFEDLRRELVSRKYSYKTINPALLYKCGVKGYLYYNKDFISRVRKNPSEIKDEDINSAPFSGVLDIA